MRIALLISSLGPGGAERVMAVLANGLAARGHSVRLITLAGREHDFYVLDRHVERCALGLTGDSTGKLGAVLANVRRLTALRRAILAATPDTVLSFVTRMNILTIMACAGLPTHLVISERVDPASHGEAAAWNVLRWWTYRRAAHVVVQTEAIARWFRARLPHPERVAVIPNPATPPGEPRRAGPRPAQPYLLGAGRLVPQKGFDLLIRGFCLAAATLPDFKLIIAGEGGESHALRELANSLGRGSAVIFVGAVHNLAELMRGATAFVLSSRYEGFPNVLLEALACGVPTIATDCPGGVREILDDGRCGVLVPCEDPQALGTAMARLAVDAELRRTLAHLGSLAVKRYELAGVLDAWEAVLRTHSR